MTTKVLATLTALVGAVSVIYSLLGAFGIELTQDQQDAVGAALGIVLVVAGIWLHPDTPLGVQEAPSDTGNLTDEPTTGK